MKKLLLITFLIVSMPLFADIAKPLFVKAKKEKAQEIIISKQDTMLNKITHYLKPDSPDTVDISYFDPNLAHFYSTGITKFGEDSTRDPAKITNPEICKQVEGTWRPTLDYAARLKKEYPYLHNPFWTTRLKVKCDDKDPFQIYWAMPSRHRHSYKYPSEIIPGEWRQILDDPDLESDFTDIPSIRPVTSEWG